MKIKSNIIVTLFIATVLLPIILIIRSDVFLFTPSDSYTQVKGAEWLSTTLLNRSVVSEAIKRGQSQKKCWKDLSCFSCQDDNISLRNCKNRSRSGAEEEERGSPYRAGWNWHLISDSRLTPMTRLPPASCLRPAAVITALSSPLVALCASDGCLRHGFLHS